MQLRRRRLQRPQRLREEHSSRAGGNVSSRSSRKTTLPTCWAPLTLSTSTKSEQLPEAAAQCMVQHISVLQNPNCHDSRIGTCRCQQYRVGSCGTI